MRSFLLLVLVSVMFLSLPATAGFRAYDDSTDLKLFSAIGCNGSGISCSRGTKDRLLIAVSPLGVLRAQVLASATTLTSAQCGSTIYNAGAVEIELPEASAVIGCRFTFVTLNAANFDIDPDAADQILVQTNAAGDFIRNATLGNTVTLEAVSASQWAVVGILGTWADGVP